MNASTLEQRAWQHLNRSAEIELPRAELLRGDAVMPEAVDWLWEGWLAAGKLHILGGQPGTGKTTIALALAASITTGGEWPDGKRAELGSVVVWSGEDDPADTLAPRLRAAGADMQRVHFVQGVRDGLEHRPFNPSEDVGALRTALADLSEVRLLVVDPIVSAVSGDSHKNAEVRRGLQPLVDLAREHRCALPGITHFTKGTAGREPVERITGSLAFGALARLVLVAAKGEANNGESGKRFLARAKSNIGPDGGGFIYDLSQGELPNYPGVLASSVLWGSTLEGSARELLAGAEQQEDDATGDAVGFLRDLLRYGARPVKGILAEAGNAGFSKDVMHRAKRKIGAVALKQGMEGGWAWKLSTSEGSEGGTQTRLRSSQSSRNELPPSVDDAPF